MKSSFRILRIAGIDIEIHITFFLLLFLFYALLKLQGVMLILGVFVFVTMHELCHSLAARYFGVKVKKITLLPIGGVASMSEIPSKPVQELVISLAGPLSNILIVLIFFYPLYVFLGKDVLMYPLMVIIGKAKFTESMNILAHLYWLNLILAAFNMLPAFPMDGGRVLRALLSYRMSYKKATDIAVRIGHIFALVFAYMGIVHGHIILLIISVFIFLSATSELRQVDIRETIKGYTVKNVLAREFMQITSQATLGKVLELMFHTHQEDFPVIDHGKYKGMLTRREIIGGMHTKGKDTPVADLMRTDIPAVKIGTPLLEVQKLMQKHLTAALPVEKNGEIVGIVNIDDINRVYVTLSEE